jgi:hypothetical protein
LHVGVHPKISSRFLGAFIQPVKPWSAKLWNNRHLDIFGEPGVDQSDKTEETSEVMKPVCDISRAQDFSRD